MAAKKLSTTGREGPKNSIMLGLKSSHISLHLSFCIYAWKITDTQAAVTCLQPVFIYNKVGAATQLYDINIIILMGNIILSPTMQSKLSPCLGSSSALFSVWGLL